MSSLTSFKCERESELPAGRLFGGEVRVCPTLDGFISGSADRHSRGRFVIEHALWHGKPLCPFGQGESSVFEAVGLQIEKFQDKSYGASENSFTPSGRNKLLTACYFRLASL